MWESLAVWGPYGFVISWALGSAAASADGFGNNGKYCSGFTICGFIYSYSSSDDGVIVGWGVAGLLVLFIVRYGEVVMAGKALRG